MSIGCDFKGANGRQCEAPAGHHWGPVKLCCHHFEQFVAELLDIRDIARGKTHQWFVDAYLRQTRRTSHILNSPCPADEPPAPPLEHHFRHGDES